MTCPFPFQGSCNLKSHTHKHTHKTPTPTTQVPKISTESLEVHQKLLGLADELHKHVISQNEAVDAVADAVQR